MIKPEDLCPCCSGQSYAKCCEPFHNGEPPPSALALMRSRYSGYALKKIDYIIKTTHPDNPESKKALSIRKKEIRNFSESTKFKGLEILAFKDEGSESTVSFKALLSQNGIDCSFQERSLFKKVEGLWLYLSGEVLPLSNELPEFKRSSKE